MLRLRDGDAFGKILRKGGSATAAAFREWEAEFRAATEGDGTGGKPPEGGEGLDLGGRNRFGSGAAGISPPPLGDDGGGGPGGGSDKQRSTEWTGSRGSADGPRATCPTPVTGAGAPAAVPDVDDLVPGAVENAGHAEPMKQDTLEVRDKGTPAADLATEMARPTQMSPWPAPAEEGITMAPAVQDAGAGAGCGGRRRGLRGRRVDTAVAADSRSHTPEEADMALDTPGGDTARRRRRFDLGPG